MFRFLAVLFLGLPLFASTCEQLTTLSINTVTITGAMVVPVGAAIGRGRGPAPPEYCRVQAVAKPGDDSEVHLEVWLPRPEAWNGKLEGTGNGGYASAMSTGDMFNGLRAGYAVAGSDTGHEGGDLKFAVGHPGKIDDWGYRAIHIMTETAQLIVRNYYDRFAAHSYFVGCSTGGQQALTEAQRYPADYDGILAGDPGHNRVRLNMGFLWSWLALHETPDSALPVTKLPLINKAAVEACDAIDGLKDGIIGDPRKCHFKPEALLCKGPDSDSCLTSAQVKAVQKIYDGAKNPRTGEQLIPGWIRGSESGWAGYFVGQAEPARLDFWRYWVFGDPKWDPKTFDFDADAAFADAKMSSVVAMNPDLRPFRDRKGRLLMYHGFADPVVPPEDGIAYYERVVKTAGANASTFARLFMVPGMGHCNGGVGPSSFDGLTALDQWVTKGTAPDRLVASHSAAGNVDRTRPLCPYPQVARYKGTGSTDAAESFTCAAPTPQKTAAR